MGVKFGFGPIQPPAQLYRLGQSARRHVEIDCRARTPAKLGAQFLQRQIFHRLAFRYPSGLVPDSAKVALFDRLFIQNKARDFLVTARALDHHEFEEAGAHQRVPEGQRARHHSKAMPTAYALHDAPPA